MQITRGTLVFGIGRAAAANPGGRRTPGRWGTFRSRQIAMSLDLAEGARAKAPGMKPTDIQNPNYFHKVVDCQWACPAHTPVPEYIRLIAEGRYTDAFMINWWSNVFPGILGRTCDRPCEPA